MASHYDPDVLRALGVNLTLHQLIPLGGGAALMLGLGLYQSTSLAPGSPAVREIRVSWDVQAIDAQELSPSQSTVPVMKPQLGELLKPVPQPSPAISHLWAQPQTIPAPVNQTAPLTRAPRAAPSTVSDDQDKSDED